MSFQHDKRVIIYPNYIDSTKTVAEGRRIPKDQACAGPSVIEILKCCEHLKLPAIIEDKHYSRDWFIRGRLRVELQSEEGALINPEVPNRRTMLVKISELVPKLHPNRSKRPQGPQIAAPSTSAAAPEASSSKAAQGSSKSNKKKNKK